MDESHRAKSISVKNHEHGISAVDVFKHGTIGVQTCAVEEYSAVSNNFLKVCCLLFDIFSNSCLFHKPEVTFSNNAYKHTVY